MQAMNNATNVISDVWLKADPNFYGDVLSKCCAKKNCQETLNGSLKVAVLVTEW